MVALTTSLRRRVNRVVDRTLERVVRHDRVETCRVRDLEIRLGVENEFERYRADTYETKEPETLDWIDRYFRPGDTFYDVGANIGLYSLYAAKRLGAECTVYAFEPEALNHARLSRNIFANGLSGVVIPYCVAVADKVGFDTFYLNPDSFESMTPGQGLVPGSALHNFGAPVDYQGRSFRPMHQQGMVGATLDHLWSEAGLQAPNHIKIDVDGLEEKIVSGSPRTFSDPRLRSVLVEISAKRGGDDPIVRRLQASGFRPVTDFAAHSRDVFKNTKYADAVNSIFVRESAPAP